MDQRWRIELLGGLQVRRGEHVVSRFPTRHAAVLLAYLALHLDRSHPREPLAAQFWPNADEITGRHNLSQALSAMRRLLDTPPESPLFLADRERVRLNPAAVTVDVQEFTAALSLARRTDDAASRRASLAHALDLYRGPLLPEQCGEWLFPQREALAEIFFGALAECAGLLQQAGEREPAIALLRRGVAFDPLREETQRDLIRLLAETGRLDAARRQYRALEESLARELGAEPSPATRALWEALPSLATDLPEPPARLPEPRTRFFGREGEIAALHGWLLGPEPERLVTITGAGGSGKTRLALEVARRVTASSPLRVVWAPLVDLTDGSRIPEAIRDALGLAREYEGEVTAQVVAELSRRSTLLVLDNFEHLVTAGAERLGVLLDQAGSLACLVTSRQCLGLTGEREFPLAPLPIPPAAGVPGAECQVPSSGCPDSAPGTRHSALDAQRRYPSVQLFEDRARAVQPAFRVSEANAGEVAAICARLEGLPLAIELAAARMKLFSPRALLERLASRLPLLIDGARDLPARQRTLRDTIRWSYDLLAPEEQILFRRLAVFAGGFTLEAVEEVCADADVLPLLTSLLEKSLIGRDPECEEEPRFRMLETVREFAAEALGDAGEEHYRERHARFFSEWVRQVSETLGRVEPEQGHPYPALRLARMEREHENARAALAWWREQEGPSEGLRLALALQPFWEARGYWGEALRQWRALLARTGSSDRSELRALALFTAGYLAMNRTEWEDAARFFRESLSLWQERENWPRISECLRYLGFIANRRSDVHAGRALGEESLAAAERSGDPVMISIGLGTQGIRLFSLGEQAAGRENWRRVLAIEQERGDRHEIARAYERGAMMAYDDGDLATARGYLKERIAILRALAREQGVALPPPGPSQDPDLPCDGAAVLALWKEEIAVTWAISGRKNMERYGICFSLLVEQGEYDTAQAHIEEQLPKHREAGARQHVIGHLQDLALIACFQGDHAKGQALLEEGLALARELGSRGEIALTRMAMGRAASDRGELPAARSLLEESGGELETLGWLKSAARARCLLGVVLRRQGELPAARPLLEDSLARLREMGAHPHVGFALAALGDLLLAQGDLARAREILLESLAIRHARRDRLGIAECLDGLARVAAGEANAVDAARLLGAAAALREVIGAALPPVERPEQARFIAEARAALGSEAFRQAWDDGRGMALDAAVARALHSSGRLPRRDPPLQERRSPPPATRVPSLSSQSVHFDG